MVLRLQTSSPQWCECLAVVGLRFRLPLAATLWEEWATRFFNALVRQVPSSRRRPCRAQWPHDGVVDAVVFADVDTDERAGRSELAIALLPCCTAFVCF